MTPGGRQRGNEEGRKRSSQLARGRGRARARWGGERLNRGRQETRFSLPPSLGSQAWGEGGPLTLRPCCGGPECRRPTWLPPTVVPQGAPSPPLLGPARSGFLPCPRQSELADSAVWASLSESAPGRSVWRDRGSARRTAAAPVTHVGPQERTEGGSGTP